MDEVDRPKERHLGRTNVTELYAAVDFDNASRDAHERTRQEGLLKSALLVVNAYDHAVSTLTSCEEINDEESTGVAETAGALIQRYTDRVVQPELQVAVGKPDAIASPELDRQYMTGEITHALMSSMATARSLPPGLNENGQLDPINQVEFWGIGHEEHMQTAWSHLPAEEALDYLGQAVAFTQMSTGVFARETDPEALPQAGQEIRTFIVESLADALSKQPAETAATTLDLGLSTALVVEVTPPGHPDNPTAEPQYTSSVISLAPDPHMAEPPSPSTAS